MSKVRINDLARELEVKSKSILDALTAVGVAEKKTHSSSIEEDEAEKVRTYLTRGSRPAPKASPAADRPQAFNLANVSKPGDALKAILERKQAEAAAKSAPPVVARPAVVPPSAPPPSAQVPQRPATVSNVSAAASTPAPAVAHTPTPGPRKIVPLPRQQANIVAPPPPTAPAIASRPPAGPL